MVRADLILKGKKSRIHVTADKKSFPLLRRAVNFLPFRIRLGSDGYLLSPYDFVLLKERLDKLDVRPRRMTKRLAGWIDRMSQIGPELPDFDLKRPLLDFHHDGVRFMVSRKGALLADQMGLGKTGQILVAARHLIEQQKVDHALLLVTKAGLPHWEKQIGLTFHDDQVDYLVLNGLPPKKRRRAYAQHKMFYLVTLETFKKDYAEGVNRGGRLNHIWGRSLAVIDEIHRIGNVSTKAYQAARSLSSIVPYRWGISGTPMDGRLLKLYGVMSFLDRDFFIDKRTFMEYHTVTDMWNNVVQYENEDALAKKLKYVMIRRLKKDVRKDLPEKTYREHYIDLSGPERKIYNKIKKQEMDLWTPEENDRINDSIPLTQLLFGQLAANTPALITDSWDKPSTKMKELLGLLEEIVPISKAVVFTKYAKMCKILHHWLPWESICYIGDLSPKQRGEAQERFLTDEDVRVFVMDTAGAEAIDLHGMEKDGVWHQGAEYLIRFDSLWNPDRNAQVEDRIHRVGQKERVTIIEMITKDTVEEKIRQRLMEKTAVIKTVIKKTMTKEECLALM